MGPWGWTVFHLPSTPAPPWSFPDHAGGSVRASPSTAAAAFSLAQAFWLAPGVRRAAAGLVAALGFAACVEKLVAEEWSAARAGRRRTQWLAHPSS